MRRDHRPFVVEVRRGQKKGPLIPAPTPQPETSPADDMMRRAEAALFGRADEGKTGTSEASTAPVRRILEVLPTEPVAAEPAPIVEPPRRGRKPGSKNRPNPAVSADAGTEGRRRGRPPKSPEGQVRSVPVTPELATAALEIMARVAATPAPVVPMARSMPTPVPVAAKRRGRPPKIRTDKPAAPAMWSAPAVVPEVSGLAPMGPIQRIVERFQPDSPVRIGRRWTRRLRGFANPDHIRQQMMRRRDPALR